MFLYIQHKAYIQTGKKVKSLNIGEVVYFHEKMCSSAQGSGSCVVGNSNSIRCNIQVHYQCLVPYLESMKRALVEFEIDLTKMPLGKLSKSQIQQERSIFFFNTENDRQNFAPVPCSIFCTEPDPGICRLEA
jgi:hypothetical protein